MPAGPSDDPRRDVAPSRAPRQRNARREKTAAAGAGRFEVISLGNVEVRSTRGTVVRFRDRGARWLARARDLPSNRRGPSPPSLSDGRQHDSREGRQATPSSASFCRPLPPRARSSAGPRRRRPDTRMRAADPRTREARPVSGPSIEPRRLAAGSRRPVRSSRPLETTKPAKALAGCCQAFGAQERTRTFTSCETGT